MKYVFIFLLFATPAFANGGPADDDYISGYTQGYTGNQNPVRDGTLYGSGYDDGVGAMQREREEDIKIYDPEPHYNSMPTYSALPEYMR